MARIRRSVCDEPLIPVGAHSYPSGVPIPPGIHIRSRRSITLKFEWQGKTYRETIGVRPTEANVHEYGERLVHLRDCIGRGTFNYETFFPQSKVFAKAKAFETSLNKTCGDLLQEWLESRRRIKESMKVEYRRMIDGQLIPRFGATRIADLTDRDINVYRDEMRARGLSLSRIRNLLIPLRGATRRACEQRIIAADPFVHIEPLGDSELPPAPQDPDEDDSDGNIWFGEPLPGDGLLPNDDPEEHPDPFTPDEREAILAQMQGQVLHFFLFMFWTGLRTGEGIALCWCDIDWANGRICIRRSKRGKLLSTPKTRAGIRWVRLNDMALAALRAQEPLTRAQGKWVFHNPRTGRVWSSDNKTRAHWDSALEKAGVRSRWQYQTRHTLASTMLSAGENALFVASQLGQKDWHQLVKVYGRWIPQVNREAGSLVDKACRDEWRRIRQVLGVPPTQEDGGALAK